MAYCRAEGRTVLDIVWNLPISTSARPCSHMRSRGCASRSRSDITAALLWGRLVVTRLPSNIAGQLLTTIQSGVVLSGEAMTGCQVVAIATVCGAGNICDSVLSSSVVLITLYTGCILIPLIAKVRL
jgi:hypothetical protein